MMEFAEDDKISQLMIENKVLECEKRRAESKVEIWKLKCRELESRLLELEMENVALRDGKIFLYQKQTITRAGDFREAENRMVENTETTHPAGSPFSGIGGDLQGTGTPLITMPSNQYMTQDHEGRKRGFPFEGVMGHGSIVRKQLVFPEEGNLSKKMAPTTPGVSRSFPCGIIDIADSEDEQPDENVPTSHVGRRSSRPNRVLFDNSSMGDMGNENEKVFSKRHLLDQSDEDDMGGQKGNLPFVSTPKRKRASNIINSDSESDDDGDNVPICTLRNKNLRELNEDSVDFDPFDSIPRRRLVALRKRPKNVQKNSPIILNNSDVDDDEIEENESGSNSEGESLGGFIVSSSDVSESGDGTNASEDVSDESVDFDDVISKIRRKELKKVKWELEADMLADFGKDLELCMKAVCALYRQQTTEEKFSKETFISNQRGFSQCDALRGTTLAEFLTNEDPNGDLCKSVEELQEYDPKGPNLCRTLATHYSKQLFAIYKNKEDPLFLPS